MRLARLVFVFSICSIFVSFGAAVALCQDNPTFEQGSLPNRSYQVGEFDQISTMNGNLTLHIPLVSYPQRGKLKLSFSLQFSSAANWSQTVTRDNKGLAHVSYSWNAYPYGGPRLVVDGPSANVRLQKRSGQDTGGNGLYTNIVSVVDSSGGVHPLGYSSADFSQLRSTDGSGYLFIPSNSQLFKQNTSSIIDPLSGVLYDSDGIATTFGASRISKISDSSGNQITRTVNGTDGPWFYLGAIGHYIDSIGRSISYTYGPVSTTAGCPTLNAQYQPLTSSQTWAVPGPNGGTQTFLFCYSSVTVTRDSGNVLTTETHPALQSVVLPNNTYWGFLYDSMDASGPGPLGWGSGSLVQVITPLGGSVSYAYGPANGQPISRGFCWGDTNYAKSVTTRSLNAGDGNLSTWQYTYGALGADGTATDYSVTVTDPNGNNTVYNYKTALAPGCTNVEKDHQIYSGSSTLLRTVVTSYTSGLSPSPQGALASQSWYSVTGVYPQTVTTTLENGQSVSTTYSYDSGFLDSQPVCTISATTGVTTCPGSSSRSGQVPMGSRIEEKSTDFGGALLRDTKTTYLWQANSNYKNANLLVAPQTVTVLNGAAQQVAQTTSAYDENNGSPQGVLGNQTSVTRWLNTGISPKRQTVYNAQGMPVQTIDGNLNTTQITYDATGLFPSQIQYPTTNSVTHLEKFSYDSNTGLLNSHIDQNNRSTSYQYDNMGRVTSVTFPDGGQVTTCYTDSGGSTCSAGPTPFKVVTTTKLSLSQNLVLTSVYDGFARLTQTQLNSDPSGTTYTDTTYDGFGRIRTQSNPHRSAPAPTDGITTSFYDALGRPCLVVPADGTLPSGNGCPTSQPSNTIWTTYSANTMTVTDQAGKSRKTVTDALGRLKQVFEDPAGLNFETDYQYDALDNLLCAAQKGTNTGSFTTCAAIPVSWRPRNFTYDSLSRMTQSTNPESGTVTYVYDANDNLTSKTSAAPNQMGSSTVTLSYCYDPLDRMLSKAYTAQPCPMSSPVASYFYDQTSYNGLTVANGIGRRTGMSDAAGAEAWSYDITPNVGWKTTDKRTTNGVSKTTIAQNNLVGSLASLTYPSGRVITYNFSGANLPTSATDSTGPINYATSATYAPPGSLGFVQNGGSLYSTYIYNSRLQPCWTYATNSGSGAPTSCTQAGVGNAAILDFQYDFALGASNNGNVKTLANRRDPTRSQLFSYDSLNRLFNAATQTTGVTIPNANCWGLTYGYDAWGNLLTSSITGPAGCSEPLPLNASVGTNNRLATNSIGSTTTNYCFDAAGNLIHSVAAPATCPASGPYQYLYDAENHLTSAGGVTYTFDGDGKRVKKSNGKLYWYGIGSDPLDETDLAGNANNSTFNEYIFFAGKRIARRDFANNVTYYFADHLGSARVVTNAGGTVLDNSDFYPFGAERAIASSSANTYKFTGKERDAESSLDNFSARSYASNLDRFISPDPLGIQAANPDFPQSWNQYSYVLNNPLNHTDPNGLWCVWEDGTHDDDKRDGGASMEECEKKGGHWDWSDTVLGLWTDNEGNVTRVRSIYGLFELSQPVAGEDFDRYLWASAFFGFAPVDGRQLHIDYDSCMQSIEHDPFSAKTLEYADEIGYYKAFSDGSAFFGKVREEIATEGIIRGVEWGAKKTAENARGIINGMDPRFKSGPPGSVGKLLANAEKLESGARVAGKINAAVTGGATALSLATRGLCAAASAIQ